MGLVQDNIPLFISGVIKPVIDESETIHGGVAVQGAQILSWWTGGFDGGERVMILNFIMYLFF
jgi:hypothetical protein